MYLYNYTDAVIVPRNHPVLVKCRGLVLDETGKVLNYPFDRFFNPHEPESATLDWDTAEVLEKIDGSLVCAFWVNDHWEIMTRGSFYPNELADVDFAQLFKKLFKNFDLLNERYSYMFEIVTNDNRIVTWYDREFVALIGMRDLTTLEEVGQDEMDIIALHLGVERPARFNASNIEECRALFAGLRDDEEGFVAVDKNFHRLKLKQDSYLKMVKIKMMSEDDLLDYVRGRTELDSELILKDEDLRSKINRIREEWDVFIEGVNKIFVRNKDLRSRKDFAINVIKYPFKALLFARLDGKDLRELRISYSDLCAWKVYQEKT